MTSIIFERSEHGPYGSLTPEEEGSPWVVGEFLTADPVRMKGFVDYWLTDPITMYAAFNFAEWDIEHGNVILGCSFLEDFPRHVMPLDKFRELINEWVRISASEAPYIILTLHNDGSFEFSTSETKPKS